VNWPLEREALGAVLCSLLSSSAASRNPDGLYSLDWRQDERIERHRRNNFYFHFLNKMIEWKRRIQTHVSADTAKWNFFFDFGGSFQGGHKRLSSRDG
jgi:hypothetical protein